MAAPTLTSISPLAGPPGTVVTCVGTGFAPSSRVGIPTLVPTTLVDAQTLTAEVPAIAGPAGGNMTVAVFVMNDDGSTSGVQLFTVEFPATALQAWTTIEAVTGELPGFARGGKTKDEQIQVWMVSIAQSIAGAMLARGLSLDPADWQQPGTNAQATPAGQLELINRLGAAASLAAAVSSQFSTGTWGVQKRLESRYDDEMAALRSGKYDKLFKPSAATIEAGPLLAAGDTSKTDGSSSSAFTKDRVF